MVRVPRSAVTVTETTLGPDAAGTTAVNWVSVPGVNVAACVPNSTCDTPSSPTPVNVTVLPPAGRPTFGVITKSMSR